MSREAPRYDMTKGLVVVASRARTDEESGEEYSSSSRARGLSYSLYSLVCIGVTYSWCFVNCDLDGETDRKMSEKWGEAE